MATNFEFEARNPEGQILTGTLIAEDEAAAEKILWQNKLNVISLRPKREVFGFFDLIFNRVSIRDRAVFARQLATMLEAGFPILQALSVIILQTPNKRMKEAVGTIIGDLEAGHSFSTALSKHPDIFSNIFVAVVKAGEAAGRLPKILGQLATSIEKDYAFLARVRGALVYPVFIICAMLVIGILMMIKVIPQLESIFSEAGAELPWPTKVVIATSHFLSQYWWGIILLVFGLYFAIKAYTKTTVGRYQIDLIKLKIPLFKKINLLIYMARFTRTFGLLTLSGIPILESLRITSQTIGNAIYEASLAEVHGEVERGVPLSVPLSKNKYFPSMVSQMIGVGEKTGKLDEILESLANFYEFESDNEIKNLSSLLEPVLIVIIGIGVAIMVFSVIMPIYQLAQIQ